MAKRLRRTQARNPVAFTFDDEPHVGEAGDSVAVALWAAGVRSLTRSPKYHRPRGPFCFTGQCEGCLLRVQDTPNTMACQVRLEEGMRVVSQNFLGSPKFDLLRAADWMFPHGLNHHEFMAGVPIAEDLMKAMARRIAGLGTLPEGPVAAQQPAVREVVDVLVVGGGLAGTALAALLPHAVVVDGSAVGGTSQRADGSAVGARSGIAIGVYGARNGPGALEVLVVEAGRTVVYAARALILATGAHEGVPTFEANDLPGIVSLRGAQALLAREVAPGINPVVLEVPGGTGLGRELATSHGYRHVRGVPRAAAGGAAIERVHVATAEGDLEVETDALIVDAARAPSFELAVQAGARTEAGPCGFSVHVDPDGAAAPGVWVVGEATGLAFTSDVPADVTRAAIVEQCRRAAASVGLVPR